MDDGTRNILFHFQQFISSTHQKTVERNAE